MFRRSAVVAKLTALGGQSLAYFAGVAEVLGFPVEFEEHRPFRVGSKVGDRISGEDWPFTLTIHAPEATPVFFEVEASAVDEPLVDFDNGVLSCVLDALRPAHTLFRFVFDLRWTGYAPWLNIEPTPAVLLLTAPLASRAAPPP